MLQRLAAFVSLFKTKAGAKQRRAKVEGKLNSSSATNFGKNSPNPYLHFDSKYLSQNQGQTLHIKIDKVGFDVFPSISEK